MKRRDFLKTLIVVASAPAIVKAENIMKIYVPKKTIIAKPFHIDYNNTIIYTGDEDKVYTVKELYRFLSDELDKPENMDIQSPTFGGNILSMGNDLKMEQDIFPHITSGSIETSEFYGIYGSFNRIGV